MNEALLLDIQTALLEVRQCLRVIASQNAPDWQRPLSHYKSDWLTAIGAKAIARDECGPTSVVWNGHIYIRRSGDNRKYGAAVWFSRAVGSDENGSTQYARLITFKDLAKAEPLPDYVINALHSSK